MDVSAILEAHKSKFKPVSVEGKVIPVEFDLGLLAAYDQNPLDEAELRKGKDAYLHDLARDNTQLLLNQVFQLPTVSDDAGVLAMLPAPTTPLPREKPLPKPKPETRWEKFAKAKGIVKRKKERMVFDEESGDYKPRWGYGGANDDGTKDWLIEVPSSADPMEDQYAARREAKKERVDKNKKRQQRNMEEAAVATKLDARAVKRGDRPNMDNVRAMKRREIENQILVSKAATASAGRFDKKMDGDLKPKGIRRQFAPTITDSGKEKSGNMDILNRIVGKGGEDLVNVRKAIKRTK
ncbi:Rhodanese- sulfurtransferase [Actinomortierella ambigua]|uniref:Ribosome biogenesis regulatory protein n=1 Tax=Actinomortierella ambigua TaxID=1343610 RepID=A0A9P6U6X6_9FUNG|nr:Rhodanese- sulfurtransferase [Actinomortierella ambigua]KAG0262273.1 Rhodanese- sulfurtransferase [Actinomortierella ambigua]